MFYTFPLFQWGGLHFYLCLGADGYCDHLVCCQRQRGEADLWTSSKPTVIPGTECTLSSITPLSFFPFFLIWKEFDPGRIMWHNSDTELMNIPVFVCVCLSSDHRHTVPGSSCKEELSSWDVVSESKHWLNFGEHVQVTSKQADLYYTLTNYYIMTTGLSINLSVSCSIFLCIRDQGLRLWFSPVFDMLWPFHLAPLLFFVKVIKILTLFSAFTHKLWGQNIYSFIFTSYPCVYIEADQFINSASIHYFWLVYITDFVRVCAACLFSVSSKHCLMSFTNWALI